MSSFDSSREPGSLAENLSPRRGRPKIWALSLAAAGYFLAIGLVLTKLLDRSFLVLGFFPALILAFYFPRWVYLGAILLVSGANAWIVFASAGPSYAFMGILLGFCLAVLLAEMTHRLALGSQRSRELQILENVRIREMLLLSKDGLVLLNSKGQILGWNQPMEEITGMKQSLVQGRLFWDAIFRVLPDNLRTHATFEAMKNEFREFSEKGQPPSGRFVREYPIIRPNGSRRTVEELIFPHSSPLGGTFGVVIQDISQRALKAQNLQDANNMLLNSVTELQELMQEMSILHEMEDQLQACTAPAEAFQVVSRFGERIFPGLSGCLFVFHEDENLFERTGSWGQLAGMMESFGMEGCWAIKSGRVHKVADSKTDPGCHHLDFAAEPPENLAYLCVPVSAQGQLIGILHLQARSGTALEEIERKAVTTAARIGMVLLNLHLQELLAFQSIHDPLTGLLNRRYMEVTFEREMDRAVRDLSPLGVILLVVDAFEQLVTLRGTDLGDMILKEVGAYLLSSVRGGDIVCRMSGEKFFVILPRATLEITNRRAEQFLKGIGGLAIVHIGQPVGPIRISAGTAGYPQHGSNLEAILGAAEVALQTAKNEGCGRVVAAEF